jgi:PAS domain S-box-containing protein
MWPIARAIVGDTEEGKQLVYVKGRSRAVGLTLEELDALKTSVTAIEEAHRLIRDKGGRLLVVFAPTAFRVYHDIADFKEAGDDTAQWELNDLPDRFRRMISEISPDIGYLDLTSALKSAARNDTLVFLPDNTHWSAEGHRVVAKALATDLMIQPKLFAGQPRLSADKHKMDSILSTDAFMVRNLDGTIRYWSDGARKLYGWEPYDALGTNSHQLLKTVFPVPLQVIEEQLRMNGRWEGKLVHMRRDGSKVTVVSHWDLQQNPHSQDRSTTVVEINGPLPISSSGSFGKGLLSLLDQSKCSNGPLPCQKTS